MLKSRYDDEPKGVMGDRDVIADLARECHRLSMVLRYIADASYVHHQSGNENFAYLQSLAEDALRKATRP